MEGAGGPVPVMSTVEAELRERLKCGICLEYVRDGALQMVCPGMHAFCFGCLAEYFTSNGDLCPTCRSGCAEALQSVSFAALAGMCRAAEDHADPVYLDYKLFADLLRSEWPSVFAGRGGCVFTPGHFFALRMTKSFFTAGVSSQALYRARAQATRRESETGGAPVMHVAVFLSLESKQACCVARDSLVETVAVLEGHNPESTELSFSVFVGSDDQFSWLVLYQHKPLARYISMPFFAFVSALLPASSSGERVRARLESALIAHYNKLVEEREGGDEDGDGDGDGESGPPLPPEIRESLMRAALGLDQARDSA